MGNHRSSEFPTCQRCERVSIPPIENGSSAELPIDPEWEIFDRTDRKFVAVARSYREPPEIINAMDRENEKTRSIDALD